MEATFKNRRRIAWISFAAILLVLITSLLGIEAANEKLIDTILYCLTGIVISYYTGVSYETAKEKKYGK